MNLLDYINSEQPDTKHSMKLWEIFKKVITTFPKWFGLYLGLIGLVTFNCFILEEGFQTVMFSSWAAFDAREYRLIKREVQTLKSLKNTLNIINNIGGWINPFGWVAYNGYVRAENEYIDAMNAKLFANAPELFDGEIITFTFHPQEEEPGENNKTYYRNGKITVVATKITPVVTGRVSVNGEKITITAKEDNHGK